MAALANQTPLPLKGRVAIVTDGACGIGSAVCMHLASLGAHVVIGYIGDPTPVENLASAINNTHTTAGTSPGPPWAIAVAADVSNAAQVKSLFNAAVHAFGQDLHILVTIAAVLDAEYPSIADTSEEKFDLLFNTNCKGRRRGPRKGKGWGAVPERMEEKGGGAGVGREGDRGRGWGRVGCG